MATAAPEALEAKVRAALDAIRPTLQADGGDLELAGVERTGSDVVVRLRLHGACRSCPSQPMTLKHAVEAQLRAAVPEVTGLRLEDAVPGKRSWNIY